MRSNFIVNEKFPAFFEFYTDGPEPQTVSTGSRSIFARNMAGNKEVLFERLKILETFIAELNKVIPDDSKLSTVIDNLSFTLSNILKFKYAEIYRVSALLQEEADTIRIADQIIESWKLAKTGWEIQYGQ